MAEYVNETQRIQEGYEKGLSNITGHYFGALDALKDDAEMGAEERSRQAWAAHEAGKQLLRQATEQRNRMFEEREATLKRKLFGGPNPILSSEQSRQAYDEAILTVSQQPWQVGEFMAVAQKTGNRALARAAFAVADEAGEDLVVNEYLNNNPDARELYEEFKAVPDADTRAGDVERIGEALIPPTESMVRVSPEAFERAQRARQAPPLAG